MRETRIGVMVVDDSAAIRGFITRWIEADPRMTVVATAATGRVAVERAKTSKPDVVVLDIEMPDMDGIEALPHILSASPVSRIIMASTLTRRNAEISLKALSLGATDYIPKPSSLATKDAGEVFRRDLCEKIVAVSGGLAHVAPTSQPLSKSPAVVLRPGSRVAPQILAIGSSTGGPQALMTLVAGLAKGLDIPVLITQHMPPTFTAILAETLSRASGLTCMEGTHGARLEAGNVYIAPGDYHMVIKGHGGPIELLQTPPENFCRPAVDPMFRSVAAAYGAASLSVVLTGMGADGREGAQAIAAAGGTILAQDEASSVVWGMPGAVAQAGLATSVLPLDEMAGVVLERLRTPAR